MRALVQRVSRAKVSVDGQTVGKIGQGLVVFLAVKEGDQTEDALFLAEKIAHLRIMADEKGKMNKSVKESDGEVLVVSQFTLYADTSYGRRPSFIKAARPNKAKVLYEAFIASLKEEAINIQTGRFGSYMEVEVINDGPVTVMLESNGKK